MVSISRLVILFRLCKALAGKSMIVGWPTNGMSMRASWSGGMSLRSGRNTRLLYFNGFNTNISN